MGTFNNQQQNIYTFQLQFKKDSYDVTASNYVRNKLQINLIV